VFRLIESWSANLLVEGKVFSGLSKSFLDSRELPVVNLEMDSEVTVSKEEGFKNYTLSSHYFVS